MKNTIKSLFIATIASLSFALPANAQIPVRVCTRDWNGVLNVRSALGKHGKIIGRLNNGQVVYLTGWNGRSYDGFNWYQTTGNGWVRGDYLCPIQQVGPGVL